MAESNEQVRDLIKDTLEEYKSRLGFNDDEALAFWHLSQALDLMLDLAIEDGQQARDDLAKPGGGFNTWTLIRENSRTEAQIRHPFAALRAELGRRVLRRDYPDGWRERPMPNDAEEPK